MLQTQTVVPQLMEFLNKIMAEKLHLKRVMDLIQNR